MDRDDLISELLKCPPGKVVIRANIRIAGYLLEVAEGIYELQIEKVVTVPKATIYAE